MDPFTHAAVGLGITALSGQDFSYANPVYAATVLGALAPDFDIIMRVWGEITYLRFHRSVSHSIIGITATSLLVGGIGSAFSSNVTFLTLFLWSLLGGISHIIFDILNSYGVKLFWPFSLQNVTLNMLLLFDPFVFALFTALFFERKLPAVFKIGTVAVSLLYLIFRYYTKQRIRRYLMVKFRHKKPDRIIVMPSVKSLWAWDFIIETRFTYLVGQLKTHPKSIGLWRKFKKPGKNPFISAAMNTKLGKIFNTFTPYFHVYTYQKGNKNFVRFLDLRYCDGVNFLHSATAVFDDSHRLLSAVFHPFNKNRHVPLDIQE
jgi:inner membrane protein